MRIISVVGFLLASIASAWGVTPVDRTLLGIFDSRHEETPAHSQLHLNAEMPLNHLGFIVRYHDIRQGLPEPAALDGVIAVISMLTYDFEESAGYFRWLGQVSEQGLKVIVLGGFGGPLTPAARRSLNRVMQRMGLSVADGYVPNTLTSRPVTIDRALIGYEASINPVPPPHVVVTRNGRGADVALEYETDTVAGPVRSVLAATGPGGGYVASGYFVHYDAGLDSRRWIIDPFRFFRQALAAPPFPVPDTTTVAGRRLYFSHVDGDGWNNLSQAENHREPPTLSSRVMLDELIAPYPDLPVSVGFVMSDGDDVLGGGEEARDVARAIFALPQVEVASHTHTHPFIWGFFEHYRRAAELELMAREQPADGIALGERLREAIGLGSGESARARRRYVAGNNHLPRAYLRDEYDTEKEIGEALRGLEALAPPGKKAALYQWSGNTRPYEAAVRATREAGVRNMNGGDTRFDAQFPSVAYIAPLSRTVGAERQIYAVNSNENLYTDLWTRRFYGQRMVKETFERTGEPVRLRGINLYYHTYSAERTASVTALTAVLDWVRNQNIIPIEASAYAAIADGFFSTRITQTGALEWLVEERDGLHTVRFDGMADHEPDLAAGGGVMGSTRHGGALYVALDPSVARAVVRLRPLSEKTPARDMAEAGLAESRWRIWSLERQPCGLAFSTRGYGPGSFSWRDLPARAMKVSARRGSAVLAERVVRPDADGSLYFDLAIDGIEPVLVEMACTEDRHSQ